MYVPQIGVCDMAKNICKDITDVSAPHFFFLIRPNKYVTSKQFFLLGLKTYLNKYKITQ